MIHVVIHIHRHVKNVNKTMIYLNKLLNKLLKHIFTISSITNFILFIMTSVSITIEDGDYLFDCVKYYTAFLLSKEPCTKSINLLYNSTFKMKNKSNKIFKKIGVGSTKLNYDNVLINIEIKEIGEPVGLNDISKIHSLLELNIHTNNKNVIENNQILDKFIDESSKYYINEILDKKKEDNKTTIYMWDEYWETLEKRLSRKLNS